jgi:predicted nucleotidyltransferase component of viral defense system
MLRLSDIMSQFPPKLHTFPKAILREYLQHKMLASIFAHSAASKLCFIGGTALRIGFDSQRFSEDLDFDNRGLVPAEFEALTEKVRQDLLEEGYEIEIRHIYKGAFHCIIKIPKLLFDNELASMATEKLTIKIDTVAQGIDYAPEMKILQQFGIVAPYRIAPKNVLLSMKFSALFERVKGRDIFDIVYLLSLGATPDWKVCEQLFQVSNAEGLKEKLESRIKELDFSTLQRDVQPFLFNPNDQSVLLFPQIIQQTTFA